jgi:hypothetical protein
MLDLRWCSSLRITLARLAASRTRFSLGLGSPLELPSDFVGVVYVPLDDAGGWQLILARELKNAGFAVDMNEVI